MSSRRLLVVFALLEALLIFACVSCEAPKIEANLTSAATDALAANDVFLRDGLVVDGRDAWLTGQVATSEAKAQAERALAAIPGVRVVHNLLTVGQAAPVPAPATPVPAPAAPAAPAGAAEIQRSIDELIAGRVVEFELGSDRLTQRGRTLVDEVAALLKRFPDARIEVAGHTDSQGTSRNNLDLSRRRAEAVRARLSAQGVDASRLTAAGYGEDQPIADNGTPEGRLQNRRVEFTVQ